MPAIPVSDPAKEEGSANDKGEPAHGVGSIPAEPGRPAAVLADNGYASEAEATGAEGRRRQRDFRPETAKEPQPPQKGWLRDMAGKLATDGGRDPFQLRERTAEPVFGIVKSVPGFRSFSLRGIGKARGEWSPVAPARNCKRLHVLQLAQAA